MCNMSNVKIKKLLCLIYCIILLIIGVSLLIFGSVWIFKIFYHFIFLPGETLGPYFIIIFMSIYKIVLAWAAYRAITEGKTFRVMSVVLLFSFLIMGEVANSFWLIILNRDMDIYTLDLMVDALDYYLNDHYYISDWDNLQSHLECCGLHDQTDFPKYPPPSCCGDSTPTDPCPEIFSAGCLVTITRYTTNLLQGGMAICFMSAFYEGLGIVLFIYYYKAYRMDKKLRKFVAKQEKMEVDTNDTRSSVATLDEFSPRKVVWNYY